MTKRLILFVFALEAHQAGRVVVQDSPASPFCLEGWLAVQPVAALLPRVACMTKRLSFLVFALEAHQARRVVAQDLWSAFLDLPTDIPYLGCLITLE
jgi:hypothetical protein